VLGTSPAELWRAPWAACARLRRRVAASSTVGPSARRRCGLAAHSTMAGAETDAMLRFGVSRWRSGQSHAEAGTEVASRIPRPGAVTSALERPLGGVRSRLAGCGAMRAWRRR